MDFKVSSKLHLVFFNIFTGPESLHVSLKEVVLQFQRFAFAVGARETKFTNENVKQFQSGPIFSTNQQLVEFNVIFSTNCDKE